MFRTSRGGARLIEAFAHAAPYPVAESLAAEVLRLMPHDTVLMELSAAQVGVVAADPILARG